MDDNGFLGLTTDLSVNDIETILLSNNFEIKGSEQKRFKFYNNN
jgi:hypothetical protein